MKHLVGWLFDHGLAIFVRSIIQTGGKNAWFRRISAVPFLICSLATMVTFMSNGNAATADGATATTNPYIPIWVAIVAAVASVFGVIFSVLYNARMARQAQGATAKLEQMQRQRELAFKIVDTIATDRTAARRFAIGLVKIEEVEYPDEQKERGDTRGKVYFIPVNSRITIGRDPENDITLHDPHLGAGDEDRNRELSRFQCGLVADENNVVVEDSASANGTLVSDPGGSQTITINGELVKFMKVQHRLLANGDLIWVGPFILRFVKLQENKILLQ